MRAAREPSARGSRKGTVFAALSVFLLGIASRTLAQCPNGVFAPANAFPAVAFPGAVATADFNGDGYLDLVIAYPFQNTISILLGDGKGGFGPATNFPVHHPIALAVADFNADGKADVLAVDGTNIQVLPGDGSGGFGPPIVSPVLPDDVEWVAVADINNDGFVDLVFGSTTSFGIVPGDGSATFTPVAFGGGLPACSTQGVLLADFNGDGIADVYDVGAGVYLLNNKFEIDNWIYVNPPGIPLAAADLNGDGKIDLVLTSQQCGGTMVIQLGDGKGGFSTGMSAFPPSFQPLSAVVADFNGDGAVDIASSTNTDLMMYALGHDGGSFGAAVPIVLPGRNLVVGDFNGDGRPDIATEAALLVNACTSPCPTSPTAVLTAEAATCTHSRATLSVALTGKPPWKLVWSDGLTQENIFKNPATRTVFPSVSTSYRVVSVSDVSCFGPPSESVFISVGPLPETSAIDVLASVEPEWKGLAASVTDHTGNSYLWTVANGVITGGQGTHSIVFTSGTVGTMTLSVTETTSEGCSTSVTTNVQVDHFDEVPPEPVPNSRGSPHVLPPRSTQ